MIRKMSRFAGLALTISFLLVPLTIFVQQTNAQQTEPSAESDISEPRQMTQLAGEQLRAFQVAFGLQMKERDLPERLKDIRNYNVKFGEDSKYFYVYLMPRSAEKAGVIHLGEYAFGGTYVLRRTDYSFVVILDHQ